MTHLIWAFVAMTGLIALREAFHQWLKRDTNSTARLGVLESQVVGLRAQLNQAEGAARDGLLRVGKLEKELLGNQLRR